MGQLPRVARAYLIVCYLGAVGVVAWRLTGFDWRITPQEWLLALGLAGLAAAAQVFVVKRARSDHSDHLTPAPLFAAVLLLPPPLLALVACLAFVPEWLVYRRKWFIQSFNIASWLIAAGAAKATLGLLTDQFRMARGALPLPAMAILVAMPAFLLTQTLLLAGALKLARGHSLRESGLFAPQKLFVELALLCCGWAFSTAWLVDSLYGIAAAVPLGLIFQALHVPNLKEEAATDPKTGLANMRHFNGALARELDRAERSGQPVSLLMCDLDYLRNINNTYGHQAGDAVLQGIAAIIQRTIRACDVAGRFGGEEFVVLLGDTGNVEAQDVAERLRAGLEQAVFPLPTGQRIRATISIGVATFPLDGRTQDALLREADLAVYQAKREGRNRVAAAGRASRELAGEWAREHLVPIPKDAPPASLETGIGKSLRLFLNAATRNSVTEQEDVAPPPVTGGPSSADAAAPAAASTAAPAPGVEPRVLSLIAGLAIAAAVGLVASALGFLPCVATPLTGATVVGIALLAGLTILAEQFAVDVGDKRGKISVSVVAVMAATFLYGQLGSLATAAAFALWSKMKAGSPLHRMVFNFSQALLAAECAGWLFHAFVPRSIAHTAFEQMLVPAAVAGLIYYAVNHVCLCAVRGLAEGQRAWVIWRANYQWLWPHYTILGVLGLGLAAGTLAFGWAGALALLAPVAMMHLATKQYMDRTAVYVSELQRMNGRLSDSYEATLQALTRALDTRDEETEEHSQRVRHYAELIARRMGLPDEEIEHVARGALLHDIGKIGVADAILLKPGPLTRDELRSMRRHPLIGYAMITHIPFLARAAQVVLHHHEAYDGSGYPSGLAGRAIPLGARIFAVADAFDAITSDRPYRHARGFGEAHDEILRCRGTQLDPSVVDAFLAIPIDDLVNARRAEAALAGAALPVAGEASDEPEPPDACPPSLPALVLPTRTPALTH